MTTLLSRLEVRLAIVRTLVVAAVLVGVACDRSPSASDVAKLPDFGGWWSWEPAPDDFGPQGPPQPLLHAPLKPEIVALLRDAIGKVFDTSTSERPADADLGIDTSQYCQPPRFMGFNGYFTVFFEILLTPGRATIADEGGLVRRIDMTGRPLPSDAPESRAGTSIGRWEGSTLVVETSGFDSQAQFFGPFKFGKGVRTVERFSITAPDVMQIALQMTAPEIFDGVFERTYTFHRDPDHEFTDQNVCTRNDRSIDHSTGQQRFDMTPPEGLPPPPSE